MHQDPDQKVGIRNKWACRRVADQSGKHDNCFTFVLDLSHDPFAIPALQAYAEACKESYPKLAEELRDLVEVYRGSA